MEGPRPVCFCPSYQKFIVIFLDPFRTPFAEVFFSSVDRDNRVAGRLDVRHFRRLIGKPWHVNRLSLAQKAVTVFCADEK